MASGLPMKRALRHSDDLRTRHTTGINPGVTRSIALTLALAPASHTLYLVTMLCLVTPPMLLCCIDEGVSE